ncbi:hypothetical protein TELCIR_16599 [Teladorsagia circumcincta]|uniref:Anillin homology domain-containing protein n=1 Tax=Teladorsagia circumcincta TaxID=45464 RepID=A0A2G9TV19_TELCI|nr:hypothetical protein TELCIR_16599 [Teladorsagia circumcincta]
MAFDQEPPSVIGGAVKERLAPFGQTATNMSFERFANNSFEKRGAMKSKVERRRSFIDNQHHQYETRTQQEWRSSTRSQWEEGKLDENFNEVRSGDWTDAKLREESKSTIPVDVQHQMDKLQYSRLSDQVFDERLGNVPYRMQGEELCKPGRSTVISKEAVEQLRQSVHVVPKPEPTYAKVQRVSASQHYPLIGQQGSRRVESVSALPGERHFENADAEKVTGEIDRMFEFVDEHDGLSTLGRETESESVIGAVKHGEYGTVRGEDVGHLPELPPMPPQPLTPHSLDSTKRRSDQPLKYSVSTISRYSRPNTQPSALATSTPVNSPLGTGLSQGPPEAPNLDDSFVSTITTASHLHDAHEEYKRQIAKLNHQIRVQEEQIEMTLKVLALARKKQKSMQELSAQRTLLLAHERLELLRCEVNRISALAAVRNPPPPVSRDLRGTMTISNITVHLNRSFCQRQYDHAAQRPGRSAYRGDANVSEFVRCGYIILNRDTVGANKFYLDEAEYPLEGIIEVYARCTTLPPAIEVDNRGFLVSCLRFLKVFGKFSRHS